MMDHKELARQVASEIREEDFAFTVEACGSAWDAYRFTYRGERGTLAFKMVGTQVTIGAFQKGELSRKEVVKALMENHEPPKAERRNWVNGYVRNGVKIAGYYRGRR